MSLLEEKLVVKSLVRFCSMGESVINISLVTQAIVNRFTLSLGCFPVLDNNPKNSKICILNMPLFGKLCDCPLLLVYLPLG